MKRSFILLFLLSTLFVKTYARIIIVDINGGGQFTSIQAAINAASTNDTIKVWPGTYFEQININKNVKILGSGYENTVITGNFNPTVLISTGVIQWFKISSSIGDGVNMSGGTISNCVITSCARDGIRSIGGTNSLIINCVVVYNGRYGVYADGVSTLSVTNTISYWNQSYGFSTNYNAYLYVSFSNGSFSYGVSSSQGCINQDPLFVSSTDYHLSEGSPCWNKGNDSYLDPDGTRSDMGYFGGPNCPIYPTVFEIRIEPSGSGVNLRAKARANY
jgi:hypothetical protein